MDRNSNGLTYGEWLTLAGKVLNGTKLLAYYEAWEGGEDPNKWNLPSKPYLFGYYFDWQDSKPFTVLALVMAVNPIEAAAKYEADSDRGYGMGEINLVGGAVWEAREVLVIE